MHRVSLYSYLSHFELITTKFMYFHSTSVSARLPTRHRHWRRVNQQKQGGLDRLLLLCLLKPPVTCRTRKEMHAAVDFSFYFICF